MAHTQTDGSSARFQTILESDKLSDSTIYCGTGRFRVHRAIESKTGEIHLDEEDLDAVRRMMSWIYSKQYDDTKNDSNDLESHGGSDDESSKCKMQETSQKILNSIRVYALGDKYDMPGLKYLAKTKIYDHSNHIWVVQDFQIVAAEIYSSTPPGDRGLRDFALQVFQDQIEVDHRDKEWEQLMRANGDLAFDIFTTTKHRNDSVLAEKLGSLTGTLTSTVRDLNVQLQSAMVRNGKLADFNSDLEEGLNTAYWKLEVGLNTAELASERHGGDAGCRELAECATVVSEEVYNVLDDERFAHL